MNTTILLLASDSLIRKVMAEALEAAGYNVLATKDIGDAVDWLKVCRPDLLMIRHYTDSLSGHDAAMNLSSRFPGIPVLLVGGLLDHVGLENREMLQGFEIFPKPFDGADLVEKVRAVLAKHAPRNEAARTSE
jgi:DNA-binding NtrC family response regulator